MSIILRKCGILFDISKHVLRRILVGYIISSITMQCHGKLSVKSESENTLFEGKRIVAIDSIF